MRKVKELPNFRRAVAMNIQIRRKSIGLTQQNLADLMGLTRSQIANIETAKCSISCEQILYIADCLRCDVSQLLNKELTDFNINKIKSRQTKDQRFKLALLELNLAYTEFKT